MFAVASKSRVSLGASKYGGTIFYIDGTGRHGLVCGPYDLGKWGTMSAGNDGYVLSPTSTYVGTDIQYTAVYEGGLATQLYLDAGGSSATWGQKLAGYNTSGSYSDWYIPNGAELTKLMKDYFYNGGGTIPNMYQPPGGDGAPFGSIQETAGLTNYPPETSRYYWYYNASVPYVVGSTAKNIGWPMRPIRRF